MTAVLAYEIPAHVADTQQDQQRIVHIVLTCGLAYAVLQFASMVLGFASTYISFAPGAWVTSITAFYYYSALTLYLLMGLVLYDGMHSRIGAIAVRRCLTVFLILLSAAAVALFPSYLSELRRSLFYTDRRAVTLGIESFAQHAATLCWLVIMIWALPRNGCKFGSVRRVMILGVAISALLVAARLGTPLISAGSRSFAAQLRVYTNSMAGIAVLVQLAGAIVASALCASLVGKRWPRIPRLRSFIILSALLLPPVAHTILTHVWLNRWGAPPEFTAVSQHCSFGSQLCWTLPRQMPAIALAGLAWSDWRRDRNAAAI